MSRTTIKHIALIAAAVYLLISFGEAQDRKECIRTAPSAICVRTTMGWRAYEAP